jgi:serine phosphatase RsbU (regulator of sigma subunit)
MTTALRQLLRRWFLPVIVPGFLALGSFGFLIHEQIDAIINTRQIMAGLDLIEEKTPLTRLLQLERGLCGLWANDLITTEELASHQKRVEARVKNFPTRLGIPGISERLLTRARQSLHNRPELCNTFRRHRDYRRFFQGFSEIIKDLILIERAIIHAPQVGEFGKFFHSLLVLHETIEGISKFRGLGSFLLAARKPLAVSELQELLTYVNIERNNLNSFSLFLSPEAVKFWQAQENNPHWQLVEDVYQSFLLNFQNGMFTISPKDFFTQASQKIHDLETVFDLQVASLRNNLAVSYEREIRRIFETGIGVSLLFLLLTGIITRYMRNLQELKQTADTLNRTLSSLEEVRIQEDKTGFQIQQLLLFEFPPKNLPGLEIESWTVPSMGVDGDFFDFLRFSHHAVGIVHGDVMGKGVPAALIGAAAKSTFLKAFAQLLSSDQYGIPTLDQVVNAVHEQMTPQLETLERFISLHALRINLDTRVLAFINCGHTPILHFQAETGRCILIEENQFPLGVIRDFTYKTHSRQLKTDDVLLLYSDGITEMRNPQGEFFGTERLQEFLVKNHSCTPQQCIKMLCRMIHEFQGAEPAKDDLTCIIIKVLPLP